MDGGRTTFADGGEPGFLVRIPIMNDTDKTFAELAKAITALCVRNTFLENLHSGTSPWSKTGDYSDVKVVTPYGEIPWDKLSRISDEEMKRLMQEIVNKVYTFLCRQFELLLLEPFANLGQAKEVVREFQLTAISGSGKSWEVQIVTLLHNPPSVLRNDHD
jgi:hypothetical protein